MILQLLTVESASSCGRLQGLNLEFRKIFQITSIQRIKQSGATDFPFTSFNHTLSTWYTDSLQPFSTKRLLKVSLFFPACGTSTAHQAKHPRWPSLDLDTHMGRFALATEAEDVDDAGLASLLRVGNFRPIFTKFHSPFFRRYNMFG